MVRSQLLLVALILQLPRAFSDQKNGGHNRVLSLVKHMWQGLNSNFASQKRPEAYEEGCVGMCGNSVPQFRVLGVSSDSPGPGTKAGREGPS